MKKYYFLLVILSGLNFHVNAQTKHGIGIHFGAFDFYGPQTGKYFLQNRTLNNDDGQKKVLYWDPAIRVSYWHELHRMLDLSIAGTISQLHYPASSKDSLFIKSKNNDLAIKQAFLLGSLQVRGAFNFLDRNKYFAAPYLTAGANMAFRKGGSLFSVPVGLGVHLKLAQQTFFNLESQYHVGGVAHLFHSAGLIYRFGKKEVVERKIETPVIADADNDGTPDATDDCPSIPGRKETKGCPDTDGDGIVDKMDDCPDIAGKPVFKGCPDSDGDGISDKTDACPQEMGIAKYNGCPVPDRDGDGFNDEVDQCPDEASNSNKGCPEVAAAIVEEVIEAAKGVNFEKNKSVLTNTSFVNLDKIVAILSKNPELKVDIEGHTDNTGSAERNAFLSQQRADVCKKYLVSKGISESRISSVGYGDIKPIADNSTEEGRAQNRRTEFILSK